MPFVRATERVLLGDQDELPSAFSYFNYQERLDANTTDLVEKLKEGRNEEVKSLIENSKINGRSTINLRPALYEAAQKNDLEMVEYLGNYFNSLGEGVEEAISNNASPIYAAAKNGH